MTISPQVFTYVSDLVRQHAAIVLGPGKEYLVESRLQPVARQAGLPDVAALVSRLQSRSDETLRRQVVEAMTTNETSFFRDREPFGALADVVLPDLVRRRGSARRLSVWSAACSTGQEAYSIAMSVLDHPQLGPDWQVEILATDINEEIMTRAKDARFSQLEVNRGLPVSMLVRYFERIDTDWRAVPAVRNMVRFKRVNLAESFDVPAMDIVFLRNVLIYFDPSMKSQVLQRVRRVLKPDGYLFLGGAETTLGLDDGFERVSVGTATAYRPRGAGAVESPAPFGVPASAAGGVVARSGLGLAGAGARAAAASWPLQPSPQPLN